MTKKQNNNITTITEKIYTISQKRTRTNGEKYTYHNYTLLIDYNIIELLGAKTHIYMYKENNKIYITSEQPDGSVLSKKLRLNQQVGTPKNKPDKRRHSFIVPKLFFKNASQNYMKFTIHHNIKDRFSNKPLTELQLQTEKAE